MKEEKEKVDSDFNDVLNHVMDNKDGNIDLRKIDELEGRYGHNASGCG
jgi:hypothetical protein